MPSQFLPEITYPLSIDTIGKELALGNEMHVYCLNDLCNNRARLNLVAIARRHGIDYSNSHDALRRVVFCQRCRAVGKPDRNLQFATTPPTSASDWPRKAWNPNPYARANGD